MTETGAMIQARVRQTMAARGLRPSVGHALCARVVAGKHCLLPQECDCLSYRTLLDHGRMWITRDGRHVLTADPYREHLDTRECTKAFMMLTAHCSDLQIPFPVERDGVWCPGHTVLIVVGPRE